MKAHQLANGLLIFQLPPRGREIIPIGGKESKAKQRTEPID